VSIRIQIGCGTAMNVVLDIGHGVTIAIMATVGPGSEARHFQKVWGRNERLHWHGFAKTTLPTESVQISPLLQ
jgi:hypothetical protein